jgi:hypothetical protein
VRIASNHGSHCPESENALGSLATTADPLTPVSAVNDGSASRRVGASVASRASKKTAALKALSGSFIVFGQDGGQNDGVANASPALSGRSV